MKVCEVCGGMGCRGATENLLCSACHGTGLICLGHESAERYEELKRLVRLKAAMLGWVEEVWEGKLGTFRKVKRRVTVEQAQSSEVA